MCNQWECQVPVHKVGRKSRTTSTNRGGKKARKFKQTIWDETSKWGETDSIVPETTESLQDELPKLIKKQWKLKETLKEQQVQIKELIRDHNKAHFKVTRQRGFASLAQQNTRAAIIKNMEFHKKHDKIHQASKT